MCQMSDGNKITYMTIRCLVDFENCFALLNIICGEELPCFYKYPTKQPIRKIKNTEGWAMSVVQLLFYWLMLKRFCMVIGKTESVLHNRQKGIH